MVSHEQAAIATLDDARKKHADVPASMREAIIGVGRAWDKAEADGDLKVIPQLSARMLDWVQAVLGRIPTSAPVDQFSDISHELNKRRRVGRSG